MVGVHKAASLVTRINPPSPHHLVIPPPTHRRGTTVLYIQCQTKPWLDTILGTAAAVLAPPPPAPAPTGPDAQGGAAGNIGNANDDDNDGDGSLYLRPRAPMIAQASPRTYRVAAIPGGGGGSDRGYSDGPGVSIAQSTSVGYPKRATAGEDDPVAAPRIQRTLTALEGRAGGGGGAGASRVRERVQSVVGDGGAPARVRQARRPSEMLAAEVRGRMVWVEELRMRVRCVCWDGGGGEGGCTVCAWESSLSNAIVLNLLVSCISADDAVAEPQWQEQEGRRSAIRHHKRADGGVRVDDDSTMSSSHVYMIARLLSFCPFSSGPPPSHQCHI